MHARHIHAKHSGNRDVGESITQCPNTCATYELCYAHRPVLGEGAALVHFLGRHGTLGGLVRENLDRGARGRGHLTTCEANSRNLVQNTCC